MSSRFSPEGIVLNSQRFLKTLHISTTLGAVYVNNPKVACSTIKLALQRGDLGQTDYLPPTSVHDHRASPLLTWPKLETDAVAEHLEEAFVFSFVRNPFTRLQSAYINKILQPQKKGAFRRAAGFAADEVPTFGAFVEAIAQVPPEEHNPHWRPQWINLSAEAIRFDFIGRLEQFQSDWARVAKKLGLPQHPERAGKASKLANASYTPPLANLVAQVYARDFETFGYAPETVPA